MKRAIHVPFSWTVLCWGTEANVELTFRMCHVYHGRRQMTKVDRIQATNLFNCRRALDSRLIKNWWWTRSNDGLYLWFNGSRTRTLPSSLARPYRASGSIMIVWKTFAMRPSKSGLAEFKWPGIFEYTLQWSGSHSPLTALAAKHIVPGIDLCLSHFGDYHAIAETNNAQGNNEAQDQHRIQIT